MWVLEIKLHSLCMTRMPFQSLFVYFDDKKSTFRMLLEPLCSGSITDSRRPFCLGINFLVVSYKPANPHRRARSGSHRLPGKRPPYHHQAWLGHYLPLRMLTIHLVEVATQARCTTLSEHLSWYFVCVYILCVVYVYVKHNYKKRR